MKSGIDFPACRQQQHKLHIMRLKFCAGPWWSLGLGRGLQLIQYKCIWKIQKYKCSHRYKRPLFAIVHKRRKISLRSEVTIYLSGVFGLKGRKVLGSVKGLPSPDSPSFTVRPTQVHSVLLETFKCE